MPERIRLRRTKGWRKPEGAVVVARPSKWGNPFPVSGDWIMWTAVGLGYHGGAEGRRAAAVALYRSWLLHEPIAMGPLAEHASGGILEFSDGSARSVSDHARGIAHTAALLVAEGPSVPDRPPVVDELRGLDLACWCPLDKPCHADVLLALANREVA